MKFWPKIEDFINKVLLKIIDLIRALVSKLTPSFIKKGIEKSNQTVSHLKAESQKKRKELLVSLKNKSGQMLSGVKEKAKQSQIKVTKNLQSAKSYDWKSLSAKKIVPLLGLIVAPLMSKIKIWYLTLKPQTIAFIVAGGAVVSLSGITIYEQAKKIADKEEKYNEREPSSITDSVDANSVKIGHSQYHNREKMQLTITDLDIPLYVGDGKRKHSVQIDFTFEASNRYIREYFFQFPKEHILRDRLNSRLEPVVPEFPLEEEGQRILREKIKEEINALIKELKIQGEVKEVYIDSILAG